MSKAPLQVLILGKTGQLAQELQRARWPSEWTIRFANHPTIDLAFPERASDAVRALRADLVINAAAYTAVDKAESERDLAFAVNAISPGLIASVCGQRGVPFVTISTDYVFDGTKPAAYIEDDTVKPINVYGQSKEEGERRVRDANSRHLILRTSWLFSAFGTNFVRTMLRLAREREELRIVADQRGKPTAAADLAAAVVAASEALSQHERIAGTYHVANAQAASWYEFASAVFDGVARMGGRTPRRVLPIGTAEYVTAAKRPSNSELACEKFERTFGLDLRTWRKALDDVLDELLNATTAA